MRLLPWLACTLLFLGAVVSTNGKCLKQNPMVEFLQKNNVTIFERPTISQSAVCKTEWGSHNTCCDAKTLMDYAQNDMIHVSISFEGLQNALLTSLDRLERLKGVGARHFLEAKQASEAESFLRDTKEFEKAATSFRDRLRQRMALGIPSDACFKAINEIRTRSLCYTCSGRSADFFLQGHALIGMQVCRNTVEACASTWQFTVDLVELTTKMQNLTGRVKAAHGKLPFYSNFASVSGHNLAQLQKWVGTPKIRQHITSCGVGMANCSPNSARALCETFITLDKQNFQAAVSRFTSRLILSQKNVQSLGVLLTPDAVRRQDPRTSNTAWKVGPPRLLQFSSAAEDSSQLVETKPQAVQIVNEWRPIPGHRPMPLQESPIGATKDPIANAGPII